MDLDFDPVSPSRFLAARAEAVPRTVLASLAALGPVLALCRQRHDCTGTTVAAALHRACRVAAPLAAVRVEADGVLEALHWPRLADTPVLLRLPDTDVLAWDRLAARVASPEPWPWSAGRVNGVETAVAAGIVSRRALRPTLGYATPVVCVASPDTEAGDRFALQVDHAARLSVYAWRVWETLRRLGDFDLVLADP